MSIDDDDPPVLRESLYGPAYPELAELQGCLTTVLTDYTIRRATVLTLRNFLSDPAGYDPAYDHLRCYRYKQGKNAIDVGFADDYNVNSPDSFPGVFVRPGNAQFNKLATGDYAGESDDGSRVFLAVDEICTITVEHIFPSESDAFDMAQMNAGMVLAILGYLLGKAGARKTRLVSIARASKKENPAPDRHYKVDLSFEVTYNLSVAQSLESHRLRALDFNVASQST